MWKIRNFEKEISRQFSSALKLTTKEIKLYLEHVTTSNLSNEDIVKRAKETSSKIDNAMSVCDKEI